MSKVVLIGGSGFIGSHVANALAEEHTVTVIGRSKKKPVLHPNVSYVRGDFTDASFLDTVITADQIVCNFVTSSVPFTSSTSPTQEIREHIEPHVLFTEYLCKKKVQKIVFASSGGGIYGLHPRLPIPEQTRIDPVSPHAIAKITIEYYLSYFAKMYHIPYLIYRISNPYGEGQAQKKGFGLIPTLFNHCIQNTSPTLYNKGRNIKDYIYIQDLARAIALSLHKENNAPVYNIGSGGGSSVLEIWQHIRDITGTDLEPVLKEKRLIDAEHIVLDNSLFREEYDWEPTTSLKEGLQKTWEAHKSVLRK